MRKQREAIAIIRVIVPGAIDFTVTKYYDAWRNAVANIELMCHGFDDIDGRKRCFVTSINGGTKDCFQRTYVISNGPQTIHVDLQEVDNTPKELGG
jgi:hypothetical protein